MASKGAAACVVTALFFVALGVVHGQEEEELPWEKLNDEQMDEIQFSCPDGFVLIQPDDSAPQEERTAPMCYKFEDDPVDFEAAQEMCTMLGATVAQPKNKYVANGIAKYVADNNLGEESEMDYTKYWIGVTDKENEGVFRWIDTQDVVDTNSDSWMEEEQQPGIDSDDADCMNILVWRVGKSNVRWHENVCNEKGLPLCQMRADVLNLDEILASLGEEVEEDFDIDDNTATELEDQSGNGDNAGGASQGPMTISSEYIEELINALPTSNEEGDEGEEEDEDKIDGATRSSICQLTCLERSLKAVCDIATFSEGDDTILVLNDESCRPTRNGTHLIVETGLDKCGTKLEQQSSMGRVSFKNAIRVKNTGAEIVRSDEQALARTELMILECTYDQAHTTWLSLKASNNEDVHTQHSIGSSPTAEALLLLYPDVSYRKPYSPSDYPVDYGLGDNIYAEIRPNVISEQIQVHILKCKATPTDDQGDGARTHWLIQKSCPQDTTFQRIHSDNSSVSRFTFEAFRFAGSFSEVYIWCTVMVCEAGIDSSDVCPYKCLEGEEETQRDRKASDTKRAKRMVVQSRNIRFARNIGDPMNDSPNDAKPVGIQGNEQQQQSQGVDDSKDNDENSAVQFGVSMLMVLVSGLLSAVFM